MCVIGISCETKEATSLFKIWKKRSNRRVQVLMTPKPVTFLYIKYEPYMAIWKVLGSQKSSRNIETTGPCPFTPFDYYYGQLYYVLLFLIIIFESVWKVFWCLKRRFSNKRFQFICWICLYLAWLCSDAASPVITSQIERIIELFLSWIHLGCLKERFYEPVKIPMFWIKYR